MNPQLEARNIISRGQIPKGADGKKLSLQQCKDLLRKEEDYEKEGDLIELKSQGEVIEDAEVGEVVVVDDDDDGDDDDDDGGDDMRGEVEGLIEGGIEGEHGEEM